MSSNDFTGTNGNDISTSDANWGQIGRVGTTEPLAIIQSNEAGNNNFDWRGGRYTASSLDYSEITLKAGSYTNNQKRVCIRSSLTYQGYYVMLAGLTGDNFTSISLYKDNGTTDTLLDTITGLSISRLSDEVLTLEGTINGGGIDLRCRVNGGSWLTWNVAASTIYNDATALSAGSPGFLLSSSMAEADSRVDDWTDSAEAASPVYAFFAKPYTIRRTRTF